jgi:hypothetical protein
MYLISVLVGRTQPLVWALSFADENNALAALGRLREIGDIDVQDDHGQRLVAKGGDLGPILFENTLQSKSAHVERALHEQRIRAMVISRMQSDPTFKAAQMAAQSPAILQAMNGMGRG